MRKVSSWVSSSLIHLLPKTEKSMKMEAIYTVNSEIYD